MTLSKDQTERFYRLYDLLSTYVHKELGVVYDEDFFDETAPRGISVEAQCETMQELWQNRDLIHRYVDKNPDELSGRDLNLVESWADAFLSNFYVMQKPNSSREVCFHEDEGYAAIVPDEVVPVLRQLDWEQARKDDQQHKMLVRIFDALLELRGIVGYDQAIGEYLALFPQDKRQPGEVSLALQYAIDDGQSQACVLQTPEADYLIHPDMLDAWRAETYEDDEVYEDKLKSGDTHEQGETGEFLSAFLTLQAEREPRLVELEMLATDHLDDWKFKFPAALAMHDFLLAHTPKHEEETELANAVLDEMFIESRWGTPEETFEGYAAVFAYYGYNDLATSKDPAFHNLCVDFYNCLPNWGLNGHSFDEIFNRRARKRTFFNPDGSVRKVGRNDPCPCGSGKKYKRCCGR